MEARGQRLRGPDPSRSRAYERLLSSNPGHGSPDRSDRGRGMAARSALVRRLERQGNPLLHLPQTVRSSQILCDASNGPLRQEVPEGPFSCLREQLRAKQRHSGGWMAKRKGGNAERLKRHWLSPKAGIRWGTPGDFNRCVRKTRKYLGPGAKGYCAVLHKRAVGTWPGKGHGNKKR